MDGLTPTRVAFGPDRRFTLLAVAAAVVAGVLAALASDAPGRLLFVVAAALLLAYALTDLVFPERLVATGAGLRIRTPLARAELAWSEVEAVRADTRLRFGLRSTTLEIDAGATLVVFSRRSLSADPAEARDRVLALGPPRHAPPC